MKTEEFKFQDPFYQAKILSLISEKIGMECEIEDTPFNQIYWSGGLKIIEVDIKLRCRGQTENDDVVLIATMARIYCNGDEITAVEVYTVDEVVNALLRKYETLYGKQS